MIQEVTEEEINALTQSILIRHGIDFTCYEPASLRRRIIRVLNRFHFTSVHELWRQFLRDSKFIHLFMNEISVGMTSMFRDPVMWKALKRIIVERDRKTRLSVWHAGCSTGEEVYSFGIVLHECDFQNNVHAYASDFNMKALEEARQGVYHKIKMIENESNYREYSPFVDFSQYYKPDGWHVIMDQRLISHAKFEYHNLTTDVYPQGFDIIFCRNVMIYFDCIAKVKILDWFHASLNPGGLLIIGFYDTMSHIIDDQKFEVLDESAKIFRKRE